MSKNKGGRPRKYKTPKALQAAVDEYFKSCEGELLKDDDGRVLLDKHRKPIYLNQKPLTVTGLAYYLGFASTQSLFDYAEDERFSAIISRAKLRIESYLEERLMDRDGQRGAQFNLQCNFRWNDKVAEHSEDESNTGVIMISDVDETTEDDVKEVSV